MSWRDSISIHPATDLFPLLGADELRELADDIKANGLHEPVKVMVGDNEQWILIDGRNRLDAMELAGLNIFGQPEDTAIFEVLDSRASGAPDIDPITYVISANIHRRHLIAETKRDLIAKLLKEHPERSDRATAELVKVDHKTVAAVRRREEDVGSIPHVEKVVDTLGRQQPTSKPNPATTQLADMGKQPRGPSTKIARRHPGEAAKAQFVGAFVGMAGNTLLHALEDPPKPEFIALIAQEMDNRQETREDIKALRDGLNRLLAMSKAEKQHADKAKAEAA